MSQIPSVDRRTFLRALAAAALAGPAIGRAALKPGVRVIVIGAGVAGLAAARMLHNAGAKVLVLEARERIGGRVHTDRSTFGVPVEIGAQYIQGTRRADGTLSPVWKMAQDNGWKSVHFSTDNAEAVRDGESVPEAGLEKLHDAFEAYVTRAASGAPRSFEAAMGDYIRQARLNSRKAAELRALVAAFVGLEFAGDIDQVSITAVRARGFEGENYILPGGFDQVPAFLASELTDVRVQEIVTTVDHSGPVCTVTTNRGAYDAEHVICTLPLGVLQAQSVRFSPALPPDKLDAIARMGMGHLGKVILEFPKRFWPDNVNWVLSLKSAAPWGVAFSTLDVVHPARNLLTMWHSGSLARQREDLTDDAVVKIALAEARQGAGEALPEPTRARVTRWGNDPYSRGAYFFPKVGSPSGDAALLSRPVGNKLFFAGEATSIYFGTVHGAILSGRREAARIIAAAKKAG